MDLTSTVAAAWGWVGLRPTLVVGENEFGNLIVEDEQGRYWRICPEELYCRVVAETRQELDAMSVDQKFLHDWYAVVLVEAARSKVGPLRPGYKYCLRVPAVLGGTYAQENLAQVPLRQLVSFAGDVARQIDNLPDGAQIEFRLEA